MVIEYYVIDTETTGLKQGFHDLVEISVIRCSDKMQITRMIKALNPKNASFDALEITKKTMSDLYQGIDINQMVNDVETFFSLDGLTPAHRCIIAHNAPFDRKFLYHTWSKHGKKFPAELWFDTLVFCRKIAKQQGLVKPKLKLHDACDLFGVNKIAQAHNARDDTRNTYLLWKKFMDDGLDILDLIKRIPHADDDE